MSNEKFYACGKEFYTEREAKEFERERRVGKWYAHLNAYTRLNPSDASFNKRKLAEHLADSHPYVYEW